jgi:hypothetical protein
MMGPGGCSWRMMIMGNSTSYDIFTVDNNESSDLDQRDVCVLKIVMFQHRKATVVPLLRKVYYEYSSLFM